MRILSKRACYQLFQKGLAVPIGTAWHCLRRHHSSRQHICRICLPGRERRLGGGVCCGFDIGVAVRAVDGWIKGASVDLDGFESVVRSNRWVAGQSPRKRRALVMSAAGSVATEKNGGDLTQPIGSANGRATSHCPSMSDGKATPSFGILVSFNQTR